MQINVQFSDSKETVITSYFSGPQDPDIFPYQGQVDTSDARWKTYYTAAYQNGSPPAYGGLPVPT